MGESIHMLREQLDTLRRELRRREVADAMAKQEARERDRQAVEVARQAELHRLATSNWRSAARERGTTTASRP